MIALSQITLTENNHVLFKGRVDAQSVAEASKDLLKLSFKTKPGSKIYLVIDSPGGSVYDGLNFVQLFATIPRNVECIAIRAYSMGHHFLQACPGKRYGVPNMSSMAHRASGSFRGTFNSGQVEQQLKLWTSIVQGMEKINAKRMGLTLPKYQSLAKDDYWCHGYDCVNKNFVDAIENVGCSEKLVNKENVEKVDTFFGSYKVYSSSCPLIGTLRYKRIKRPRRR